MVRKRWRRAKWNNPSAAYTAASLMIVGWNVTHRMLPVRVFSIASPPPGTLQATKGGIINWRPLISLPSSIGCRAARLERAGELGDPQVHQVEVRVDPARPTGV